MNLSHKKIYFSINVQFTSTHTHVTYVFVYTFTNICAHIISYLSTHHIISHCCQRAPHFLDQPSYIQSNVFCLVIFIICVEADTIYSIHPVLHSNTFIQASVQDHSVDPCYTWCVIQKAFILTPLCHCGDTQCAPTSSRLAPYFTNFVI